MIGCGGRNPDDYFSFLFFFCFLFLIFGQLPCTPRQDRKTNREELERNRENMQQKKRRGREREKSQGWPDVQRRT